MQTWRYELSVPDDTPDEELPGYRDLAISTWRTGAECMGGSPGEARATLVPIAPISAGANGRERAEPVTSSRAWRIEGEVT